MMVWCLCFCIFVLFNDLFFHPIPSNKQLRDEWNATNLRIHSFIHSQLVKMISLTAGLSMLLLVLVAIAFCTFNCSFGRENMKWKTNAFISIQSFHSKVQANCRKTTIPFISIKNYIKKSSLILDASYHHLHHRDSFLHYH